MATMSNTDTCSSFQFQALSQNSALHEIRSCIAETHAFDGPEDWLSVNWRRKDPRPGQDNLAQEMFCPPEWLDPNQLLLDGIVEQHVEDFYFSQHSFNCSKRRNVTTSRLNALFVDCDQYQGELTKQEALGQALDTIEANGVPAPTFWRDSGRGFNLVWLLQETMATPATRSLWQLIEAQLVNMLLPIGGDRKAELLTQILRPRGSINSKSGTTVMDYPLSESRYLLGDMAKAVGIDVDQVEAPPAARRPRSSTKRKRQAQSQQPNLRAGQNKVRRGPWVRKFNQYQLGHARAQDVETLNRLRSGFFPDSMRNHALFVYAQALRLAGYHQEAILQDGRSLNAAFRVPLGTNEVQTIMASREAPDVVLSGFNATYRLRNKWIVEALEITLMEQVQLTTIIGQQEKRRRKSLTITPTGQRVLDAFYSMPTATQQLLAKVVGTSQPTVHYALRAGNVRTVSKRGRPRKDECKPIERKASVNAALEL